MSDNTNPWSSEAELAEDIARSMREDGWAYGNSWSGPMVDVIASQAARIAFSRPLPGGVSAEDVRMVVVYHEWAIGPAPLEEQPYAQKDVNTAARRILAALDGAK